MPAGKFIVFEGLDGSGQSTQVKLLADYLTSKGKAVLVTKEPTQDNETGKRVVAVLTHKDTAEPLELQELFAEDRSLHLKEKILPALEQGKIVISDRYRWSTYAFGSIDCSLEALMDLNKDFPDPDLTLIMRVRPEVSLERIEKRGKPVEFFEKLEKLQKVCVAYDDLVARFPEKALLIDGEQPIEKVHAEVMAAIAKII